MTNPSTTADWQPRLGVLGEIVEDVADIEQCLRAILVTPKGSVPCDPAFGCDLVRYLDRPLFAARAQITREVLDAIAYGEPRVKVVSVQVTALGVDNVSTPGALVLDVAWTIPGLEGTQRSSFDIGGNA